jgi:hypothetical protein
MEEYVYSLTGKKICRKSKIYTKKEYDREERCWANICYPIQKDKDYGKGKTFYNRDDDEDSSDEQYIQIGGGGGGGNCLIC